MSTVQPLAEPETDATAFPVAESGSVARPSLLSDYSQLFKVRVTSLIVMTAWTGYYMGAARSGVPSLSWKLLNALLGIGLTCAGSAALNEVLEHRVDAKMARTRNRPLPSKRMSLSNGWFAGLLATLFGSAYLAITTNVLTGVLALCTAACYLAFYTPLKRLSPISTFIGAFPGAMPPLLGWTAMRGHVEKEALVLFAIVFFWQFPHFQAIAWMYRDEYEGAGIKMLPVVDASGQSVIRQMISYGAALLTVSVVPGLLHMAGAIYIATAMVLGLAFLGVVLRLALTRLPTTAPDSRRFARQLLLASVLYLPMLFGLMMINAVRS